MSRGEVLAFAAGVGGAAVGWTVGEKVRAGAGGALVGFGVGITAAYLLDTKLLPPPPEPKPPLAGYDPAYKWDWYYVDSWAYFIGGWTPSGSKGPWWGTDFEATIEEEGQAFNAHEIRPKYISVRRFRWTGNGWVKEPLQGDWSRMWSV